MSGLGDAMTRKIKAMQEGRSDSDKAAAEEARKLEAEEAKRILQGNNGETK